LLAIARGVPSKIPNTFFCSFFFSNKPTTNPKSQTVFQYFF
jgi:hypothetical protein